MVWTVLISNEHLLNAINSIKYKVINKPRMYVCVQSKYYFSKIYMRGKNIKIKNGHGDATNCKEQQELRNNENQYNHRDTI